MPKPSKTRSAYPLAASKSPRYRFLPRASGRLCIAAIERRSRCRSVGTESGVLTPSPSYSWCRIQEDGLWLHEIVADTAGDLVEPGQAVSRRAVATCVDAGEEGAT